MQTIYKECWICLGLWVIFKKQKRMLKYVLNMKLKKKEKKRQTLKTGETCIILAKRMIGIHQHRKMWNTWNAVEWFLTFSKYHKIPRKEATLIQFLFLPLKCKTASRKMNLPTTNKSYNIMAYTTTSKFKRARKEWTILSWSTTAY